MLRKLGRIIFWTSSQAKSEAVAEKTVITIISQIPPYLLYCLVSFLCKRVLLLLLSSTTTTHFPPRHLVIISTYTCTHTEKPYCFQVFLLLALLPSWVVCAHEFTIFQIYYTLSVCECASFYKIQQHNILPKNMLFSTFKSQVHSGDRLIGTFNEMRYNIPLLQKHQELKLSWASEFRKHIHTFFRELHFAWLHV